MSSTLICGMQSRSQVKARYTLYQCVLMAAWSHVTLSHMFLFSMHMLHQKDVKLCIHPIDLLITYRAVQFFFYRRYMAWERKFTEDEFNRCARVQAPPLRRFMILHRSFMIARLASLVLLLHLGGKSAKNEQLTCNESSWMVCM